MIDLHIGTILYWRWQPLTVRAPTSAHIQIGQNARMHDIGRPKADSVVARDHPRSATRARRALVSLERTTLGESTT